MSLPSEKTCRSFLLYVACGVSVLFLAYGAFALLFRLLLPFALAWAIAFGLQPPLRILHRRTGISKKVLGFFLLALLWGVVLWMLFLLCARLVRELQELLLYLQQNAEPLLQSLQEKWQSFRSRLPFDRGQNGEGTAQLGTRVTELLTAWTAKLPAALQKLFRFLPNSAFSLVIFFLATFYYTVDFSETNQAILHLLPTRAREGLQSAGKKLRHFGKRYLHAYLLLLLLTMGELWLGLVLLRVPYAFGLAFLIAALDFLPVIGVGTVLLPWAGIGALFGNYSLALGLLILFAVITIVRQVAEPHILGAQLGLSPLATLCATYVGYRAFGFLGLLLAPAVLLVFQTKRFAQTK